MKTLLVIDGNSILNRAFYGIRPLTTKTGLPTNAVYGFITILKKHIDALAPDRILCAFDRKAPTFRHKMYDGYKATRKGMPEELAMQLPYAKEVAAAMGCCVVSMDGYEADDILGTASAMAEASGDMHTFILTGDRDSLQLVSPKTTVVLIKTKEDILYTPDVFFAEYGITPTQFVDVKALMGDTSDNIPGVPGIGEKTALKLIGQAGSLTAVYENLDGLGLTKSVYEKLKTGEESAHLSRRLADIFREVPMETCLICTDCAPDRAKLNELFTELEFTALKSRFSLTDEEPAAPAQNTAEEIPTFVPLSEAGALTAGEPIVCALTDNGDVAAVCGDAHIIIPTEVAKEILDAHPVVCHDYKKLYAALTARGITPHCKFDTMLAAYLLAPGEGNYPLSRVAPLYLGCELTENTAEAEAHITARLYPILKAELEKHGMMSLLTEIEIPLAEVLAEMEEAGFTLDADGLHEYITALQISAEELAQTIYEEAGAPFNINSPKQLGEVLFERLGLPPSKKTQRGYSTDAETLEKLRPYHPIIGHILDYRQLVKLTGTYGDNLIALMGEDGKIHSQFNQTGTATGRLSSNDPNMQNIPVRGQLGRELRRYFTAADTEHVLLDADYSQIELRLLAVLSGDKTMQHAFLTGEDIHRATASQVFRTPIGEVTPELRSRAKAVNFGIVYGIGEYSLSQDLGISRARAGEYIRSYLDTYPDVERYLDETVEAAKRDGYTTTMFARKRFIPELSSQNKNIRAFGERVAKNSPIQGTAADIIKIAMIRTRNALRDAGIDAKLILQVHDELIVEVAKRDQEKAAEILGREMEGAVSFTVPLTAEVSAGENWFEAKQ